MALSSFDSNTTTDLPSIMIGSPRNTFSNLLSTKSINSGPVNWFFKSGSPSSFKGFAQSLQRYPSGITGL